MQYKFHLNNLRMAPRKVRQVIALIKGASVEEAEIQLKFRNRRAALPILKLLKSGIASAVNNFNLSADNLYVAHVFVGEGQTLKRFRPRAFGRASAIHKKTSHVTLILEERAAAVKKTRKKISEIIAKKEETPKEIATAVPKKEAPKEIKPKGRFEGIARRIFRRKAIG